MAPPQKRKKQQTDSLLPETLRESPAKRLKTKREREIDTGESLTLEALEEHDRRDGNQFRPVSPPPLLAATNVLTQNFVDSIVRFASGGGPDLRDLRGYPPTHARMSSRKSSQSGGTRSVNPASTTPTSVTTRSKKSTPYNRDFDLHLTDHQVYATYSSQKPDLAEIKRAIPVARASLSPSKFSEGAFEAFQDNNARAKDEDDVLANVIPIILGPSQTTHPSSRNTTFGNLGPLTDGTIAPAKPDIYYGVYPEEVKPSVRHELARHITPSSMCDRPVAPNFFMEIKGPDGSTAVATRQARYDGAIGARGMHSLQNYSKEEAEYDGKAYTISSTWHDGTLKMYAHHLTPPSVDGGPPEYHMTQIDAFAMTGSRDGFVQGASGVRNLRDLTKHYRDRFVQDANSIASQSAVATSRHGLAVTTQLDLLDGSSDSDDFVDCTDQILPTTPDELVHGVAHRDGYGEVSAPVDLSDQATSSVTSSSNPDSAKRPRPPVSPGSKFASRSPPSKIRQPGTSRRGQEPLVSGLLSAFEAEEVWVDTHWHEGQVCFRAEKELIKTDRGEWDLQTGADGSFCFRWRGSTKRSIWTKTLATGGLGLAGS